MPERRSIRPKDLLRLRWVSDPVVRRGDDSITFTLTSIDATTWDYRAHLYGARDGSLAPLTDGPWMDRAPRWSPDGERLAFVSNRSGRPQVWIRESNGALTQLTDLPPGVTGAPLWTPDGAGIIFNAPQVVDPPVGRPGEPAPSLRVIRRLDYRADPAGVAHGARGHVRGFRDGRCQQIFWVSSAGGPARQLTSGDFEHLRPQVSPNGRLVAFIANRTDNADRTVIKHVWTVPVEGGEIRRVSGGWGPIEEIAWAPAGDRLAITGHLLGDRGQDRTQHHVIVADLAGGAPVVLTETFEPTLGVWVRGDARMPGALPGLVWDETGIYFIASTRGAAHLYRSDGAQIRRVVDGARTVSAFDVGPGGRVAFIAETAVQPGDVFAREPGGDERRLTDINADLLHDVELSTPQHFTFPGVGGQAVDAWITPPVPHEPGRRYPLVLETHRGAFGHGFFFEFQALAAGGFAVLVCNHVGAQGYGQEYALGQHQDWGGADAQEMLRGVDAAAAFEFVDPARVGTIGLSAGGFYTNWLLGETDRFKAGVSEAGIWNWLSMFGTSDIGYPYVVAEMGGPPWTHLERYWRMSPLSRAHRITAPLLIIHADEDYRVDISESAQLFQAMRYLGRTVEFLWFEGETHGFSRIGRPVNRVERLRRIIDWFTRYL